VNCDLSPDHVKEERYEELCALAAIGELSAAEFAELSQHLADCTDCQSSVLTSGVLRQMIWEPLPQDGWSVAMRQTWTNQHS